MMLEEVVKEVTFGCEIGVKESLFSSYLFKFIGLILVAIRVFKRNELIFLWNLE